MPLGWQQIESPLSPVECAERLQKAIDPSNLLDWPSADGIKPVFGYVENGWFELRQRGPRSERDVNALQGQFVPGGAATTIRFRCTWGDGPRWAGWFSVIAAIAFGAGTLAFIACAYLDPPPGPRPYAWVIAIVPLFVVPAVIHGYWRATRLARQQQAFLAAFLERTVKGVAEAK
jgi:hypothetical protein